jgi:hypothetical protein
MKVQAIHRRHGTRGEVRFVEAPSHEPGRHAFRAARMLAVAHALAGMLPSTSREDLARALGMSQARLSQLLDLLLLAPDIQEELLFMEAPPGADPLPERALRHVVRALGWPEQRRRWAALRAHGGRGSRARAWAGEASACAPAKPPRSHSEVARPPR